jgi:Flp pilus assembly protein TadG
MADDTGRLIHTGVCRSATVSPRKAERGFSLVMVTVMTNAMLAAVGLTIDLGRAFIIHNELQAFSDAAAMAAVRALDGTQTGIQNAHTLATQGPLGTSRPNAVNFGTAQVTGATDTYATSFASTYDSYATAAAGSTNQYRFVKVTASNSVPLYFLGVLPGVTSPMAVQSSAIAGQQAQTPNFNNGGLIPFSVDAHSTNSASEFGLTRDTEYTLKWGNGNTTNCAGDSGFSPGNAPDQHGFVNIGQGNSNSNLTGAIEYSGYPNTSSSPNSVGIGTQLSVVPGNRGSSIFNSLESRSNQDPDQTDTTWDAYKAALAAGTADGRRIVAAPVMDPNSYSGNGSNRNGTVIGFADFLLDPASTISGSSGPICATYIGPASSNGLTSGGTNGASVYVSMLFQ